MNPHQKNKIDVKSLSPDEQRLFRLYGKLPSKSDHFAKHLKDRKYFDSGDYAMSKAGKGDSVDTGSVGTQHPTPENVPPPQRHERCPRPAPRHSSPIKESSFLNRETSADDAEEKENAAATVTAADPASTEDGAEPQGIPIRR
ncbi:camp-regulated phosphoprotein family protein [Apiospora sp. TS-2023a]